MSKMAAVISVKIAFILSIILCKMASGHEGERRLIEDLLANYNVDERPSADDKKPVIVEFKLYLRLIVDLNEINQILKSYMWMHMKWTDYNLVWNETDYGGTSVLSVPKERLWTPDIILHNSVNEKFDNTYASRILVYPDGTIDFIPPGIFESSCQIDVTWFPFDDQSCLIKFSSWTYNIDKLNVVFQEHSSDLSEYTPSGEWDLLGFPGHRNLFDYEGEVFPTIEYRMNIRRRTMYYIINLIVPCLLIALLAIIGFCTPPDCGEKVTLEISILMALIFYTEMVTSMVPFSSDTPLIGIYFSCIMIMVANSTTVTILILNYHHHHKIASGSPMPRMVKLIFLQWLPWLLLMRVPKVPVMSLKAVKLQIKMREMEKKQTSSKSLLNNVLDLEDDFHVKNWQKYVDKTKNTFYDNLNLNEMNPTQPMIAHPSKEKIELSKILKELKVITNKIKEDEIAANIENEWKVAAMALDRLCLVLSFLLTVFLSTAVALTAPQLIVW